MLIVPATLPVISIDPYLSEGNAEARAQTSRELHDACRDYGFFYLDISRYAFQETDELERLAREFFSLPQEEKDKISLENEDGARGYARLKENVTNGKEDNHEGIDFYRPVDQPDKTKPLWGTNQWPSGVPGFQEKYEQWAEKMKALGLIVMEAMSVGLGMTPTEWEELRVTVEDTFWVMRTIGYPPLPDDHDGFSCGSHKDYGCLTFLYADPTPSALQVFTTHKGLIGADTTSLPTEKDTQEGVWINADPIPGCIVCNIGEMWEIWTNGIYKSTLHRVMHRGTNYRVSIPFFFEPSFDAVIKPLAAALRIQEKTGTTAPEERRPVVYGEFLMGKVGNNFSGKGKYDTDE